MRSLTRSHRTLALAGAVLAFACGEQTPRGGGAAAGQAGLASTGGGGGSDVGSAVGGGNTSSSAGSSSGGGVGGGGSGGGMTGGGLGVAGGAGEAAVDWSAELYDPEQVPRFELTLPAESVSALGEDPDTYVRGSLAYAGEEVADIGVRIKGEASLRTLGEKAAFKLKFDEFVSKQSFRGLRRMTFNNMIEDPSYVAERLAFHFFRERGLPAPRCNHALIYVNGTFFGLYANVETEDKTFLRRWFDSDSGNLYEEGQVDFDPGNENEFELETNEERNDRSDLMALISALAGAQPSSFLTDVGAELDMAHFLAFTAAEAAVNQWDMYAYTVFYPNNFRIYRDPAQQKFVMLPWGMDMSMKPFRDSGRPYIEALELSRVGDSPNRQVSAGKIFRGCLSSPACREAYVKVVLETATSYEQAGLEALAKKYYDQVRSHIATDPRTEYEPDEIEAAYESVLEVIRDRPATLRASVQ